MQPSEIIREALNLMFERGHAKGALEGPDGSLCAIGACLVAETGTCAPTTTQLDLWAYAALRDAIRGDALPAQFNDAPERTFDEIVDWFNRAEKIAEQREHAS